MEGGSLTAPQRHAIFVYGTLLRGERNHGVIAGALFFGEAKTEPGFELVDLGGYPAMVAGGNVSISGEVYAVDSDTLAQLDELEEHPDYYRRLPVRLATGLCVEAYLLGGEHVRGYPRIVSGCWRRRPK